MSRKNVAIGLLVGLLVIASAGLVVALLPRSSVSKANFDRITDGMTLAEVEAILDGPERDETNGDFVTFAEAHAMWGNSRPYFTDADTKVWRVRRDGFASGSTSRA